MKMRGAWQRLNALQRMQWLFAVLAVLVALSSLAGLHSHEDGIHATASHCISCDLEDVTTHGALTANVALLHVTPAYREPFGFTSIALPPVSAATAAIRAPPHYS